MRKILYTIMVFCLVYVFGFMMLVAPARALTGYDDVILASTVWAVKNTPVRQLVGAAASATAGVAGGSLAVTVITAGAPWLALGVAVGLGVAYVYYNSADLVALYNKAIDTAFYGNTTNVLTAVNDGQPKTAQTISGNWGGENHDQRVGPFKTSDNCYNGCTLAGTVLTALGYYSYNPYWGMAYDKGWRIRCPDSGCTAWPGSTYYKSVYMVHLAGNPTSQLTITPADHSATGLTNWLANNPADVLAPETRHMSLGAGQSSPVADTVATLPLTTTEAGTVTTKASIDVGAGDIVVAPSVPPPAGSQTTETQIQQSTTTTTTTTNPDGSVTADSVTEASAVCTAVGYSNKTFGTVLQSHVMDWQASPVIASLSNLSGVVFPSSLPTYSFNSSMWGNHSLNMNDYGYVFVAIKILVLACTTILCYRLVFG